MNNFFYEYKDGKVLKVEFKKGEKIPIKGKKLNSFLKEGKIFSKQEIYVIMEQLLMILDKMRSVYPPIVHKNINPHTVIIKKNWEIAIIAYNLDLIKTTYTAPEIMDLATPKSDLYSVGMLLKKIISKGDENLEKFISYMIANKPEYRFKDIKIALNILKKIKDDTISDADWPSILSIYTNNSNYEYSLHNELDDKLIALEDIERRIHTRNHRRNSGNRNIFAWIHAILILITIPIVIINNFLDEECNKAPMGYYNDEECNLHPKSPAEIKQEIIKKKKRDKEIRARFRKLGITKKIGKD